MRRNYLLVMLVVLPACSKPPLLVAPVPAQLTANDISATATLLRLEDRRDYDAAVLAALAADSSSYIRRRAALAAGRIRDPRALPLLAPLLVDPDTAVAAAAAFAAGLIADTAAVRLLGPLLSPEMLPAAPTVAAEAATALGKIGGPVAEGALERVLREAEGAGASALPVRAALLAIWKFDRPADIGPVTRWLGAPDPELRWSAAYALVRRRTPAAVPLLLALATDDATEDEVRAIALRGLTAPLADSAGVEHPAILALLIASAGSDDYATAINAIRSLGTFSEPAVVGELQALLADTPAHRRWAAIEALQSLGAAAAAASADLEGVVRNSNEPTALRAAALLALNDVDAAEAEAAAGALAAGGWRLRAAASQVLAMAQQRRGAAFELPRDPDARVQAAALRMALEAAGDSVAPLRRALLDALGSADPVLRASALGGFETLADPATLPLLLDAYDRAQRDTLNDAALAAVGALEALEQAGSPAAAAFFRRFSRPDDDVLRRRAAAAFPARGGWGDVLPIETQLSLAGYRALAEEFIAPVVAGAANPRVRIDTEGGSLVVELLAAGAPLTVANFLNLTRAGYFDGQEWPRVVPNFVVQGGDPRGDTSGGPGWSIRDEINRYRYRTGTLGMALSGPDTGGSQFFITHSPQPHLDGIYTIFGRVVENQEVIQQILPGQTIHRIEVLNP